MDGLIVLSTFVMTNGHAVSVEPLLSGKGFAAYVVDVMNNVVTLSGESLYTSSASIATAIENLDRLIASILST